MIEGLSDLARVLLTIVGVVVAVGWFLGVVIICYKLNNRN